MKRIDFSNFFVGTVANWSLCEVPDRLPDFVSGTGSAYWDYGNRVRRWADHWGVVRSCRWYLDLEFFKGLVCGECYYDDFRIKHKIVEWELNCG
jgi:hypothetical protein